MLKMSTLELTSINVIQANYEMKFKPNYSEKT